MASDDFGVAVISLDDRRSVQHWCEVLGCNEAELIQAVMAVGPAPGWVAVYLKERATSARAQPPPPD